MNSQKDIVSADAWKLFKPYLLCQDTNLNSNYKNKRGKKENETYFKSKFETTTESHNT